MSEAILEHVNVTVSDLDASAAMLCELFEWKIRWIGDSIHGGRSAHVGGEASYIAIYTPPTPPRSAEGRENYFQANGLNHIAVTVDDLDAVADRVRKAGFEPHSFADYEPGRRFYFIDGDGIEYEIVNYD